MRNVHRLATAPAVLLLVSLSLAPLYGQEDRAMKTDRPLADGKLEGAEGHRGSGTVHILGTGKKHRLHFTSDFSVEKGPDVYVTLTKGPRPVEGSSLTVAKLNKFSGEQSFDLPAGADPGRYSHLVLWCKKYSVAMAVATFTHHAMMEEGDTGKPATPE